MGYIGEAAFYGCPILETVAIGKNMQLVVCFLGKGVNLFVVLLLRCKKMIVNGELSIYYTSGLLLQTVVRPPKFSFHFSGSKFGG